MTEATRLAQEFMIEAFARHDGHDIKEVEIDEWRCTDCQELVLLLSTGNL